MNKRFAIILAGLIVVFGGLMIFNKRQAKAPENGGGSNTKSAPTSHKTAEGSTGVLLREFGDFQCPACGQYYPVVKQLKTKYAGQITFQFSHFPLAQIHNYAMLSARAAEAAGQQKKFFEMHDLLYENQQTWTKSPNPTQIFEDYAAQLGLNVEKFQQDMKSDKINASVQADLAEANKKEYKSTPTFEINGKKIENPRSAEEFQKLIEQAIKDKQKTN